MPVAIERKGQAAAPGLAVAPLEELLQAPPPDIAAAETATAETDPDAERSRLEQAIRVAIGGLNALAAGADCEAGEILAFQVAMLEDPNLAEPAWQAIATGTPAASAWTLATAPLIADFEGSGDALFAARASDLCDLRDRVLAELNGTPSGRLKRRPGATVLLADDLSPSQFLSWTWHPGSAIALRRGSAASHVALLARSRGIPMVVGLGPLEAADHQLALVDGDSGRVVLSPDPAEQSPTAHAPPDAAGWLAREASVVGPALTVDGVAIHLQLNINSVNDLAGLDPSCCDGIGLVRSEFLFSQGLPREEEQFQDYRRILEWADGRPVVIRTLDAGGDKPIPGLSLPEEANPFLGCRGLRFSLAHPTLFEVQLRALARAACKGDLRILLPMVTLPAELDQASALLDQAVADLQSLGLPARRPPLGVMVEVPAVAIKPELFHRAAFFSIGSNDLTQYVMAAARDNASVTALHDCAHPAVIALIEQVVNVGASLDIPVSLCGDMAGDPNHLAALLDAGLRRLSVAPTCLGATKRHLAQLSCGKS
jgi:phosphotransferase system enzyme I (PtsI)